MMAYRMTDKTLRCAKLLDLSLEEVRDWKLDSYRDCDILAQVVVDSLLYLKDLEAIVDEEGYIAHPKIARKVMKEYTSQVLKELGSTFTFYESLANKFIDKLIEKYKYLPIYTI